MPAEWLLQMCKVTVPQKVSETTVPIKK